MNQGFNPPPGGSDPAGSSYFPPPYSVAHNTPAAAISLPPAARSIPTVLGLLNALKRRWVLATFLGLLAALAAAAGFWLAAPTGKNQIKALVEIKPLTSGLDDRSTENDSGYADFKQNQETLIKTRTLLSKVVQDPKVAVLPMISGSEDPVRHIEDLISTKWPGPSLMAVTMNGDQADQLKTIMDVLIVKYIEQSRMDMLTDLENKKKTLQDSLDKEIANHQNQMEFLVRLQEGTNASPDATANADRLLRQNEKISKSEGLIEELQRKHASLEAAIKSAKVRLENPAALKPPENVIEIALDQDPIVQSAFGELETARTALNEMLKKGGDPDKIKPAVDKYRAAVDTANSKFLTAKETRRPQIEKSLNTAAKAEVEYKLQKDEGELAVTKAEITTAKNNLATYNEEYKKLAKGFRGQTGQTDLVYLKENIYKLREKIRLVDELLNSKGRIVEKEKAIVIPNPNIRQKMMFGVAIAILAFGLVLVIVAYLEWRSRRVDSVDQVLNELNMRVLGTIPAFPSRASLRAGEADMNQNWRFILNESVNSARTMLLHSAKSNQMQVLMVTSAMQGEGKTSLASQLATSMATAGLRTLILDLDLRNPSMNRLFDLPLAPGASEILLQEVDVSDAVQPTTVPNLWVIPAGQCSNRVIASLAQGHPIEMLFNRLRGQFEFIVVDTCPVLPVADAMLIGQHVDGVVFSILQDISQLPKVLNASERLAQLNIPLLGAVVNGIRTDVHAYGYNYVKQLPA